MNSPALFFFLLSALAPSTVAQSLTFTVIGPNNGVRPYPAAGVTSIASFRHI
jgi:hypothetical protein